MSGPFLVVDGTNILMRAVHLVHSRRSDPVSGTGMVLDRFVGMLARHLREEEPERLVVCWDDVRSWRTARWAGYKAQRSTAIDPDAKGSAFDAVKSFLHLCGIPNAAGFELEADDVIAAFWRGARLPEVTKLLILSSDNDFAQLVGWAGGDDSIPVEQIKPGTDGGRVNLAGVRAKWGCDPEHVAMVRALAGDSSDGIPGLRNVGPARALKMLTTADFDLTAAVAEREVTERERVATYLALVDLRTEGPSYQPPAPFVPYAPSHERTERAAELLSHYELISLRSQLLTADLWPLRQDASSEARFRAPATS